MCSVLGIELVLGIVCWVNDVLDVEVLLDIVLVIVLGIELVLRIVLGIVCWYNVIMCWM